MYWAGRAPRGGCYPCHPVKSRVWDGGVIWGDRGEGPKRGCRGVSKWRSGEGWDGYLSRVQTPWVATGKETGGEARGQTPRDRGSEPHSQGPGPCSPSCSLPSLKNVFVSGLGQAGHSGLHTHHLSPGPSIPPEVRVWVVDLSAPRGDLAGALS